MLKPYAMALSAEWKQWGSDMSEYKAEDIGDLVSEITRIRKEQFDILIPEEEKTEYLMRRNQLVIKLSHLYEIVPGGRSQAEVIIDRIAEQFVNKKRMYKKLIEDMITKELQRRQEARLGDVLSRDLTLERDKSGQIIMTTYNLVEILDSLRYVKMVYDDFTGQEYLTEMPWSDKVIPISLKVRGSDEVHNYWPIDNANYALLMEYLGKHVVTREIKFSQLKAAITAYCQRNRVNIYKKWMLCYKGIWDIEDRNGCLLEGTTEQNYRLEPYASSWRECYLFKYLHAKETCLNDVKWVLACARVMMLGIVHRCLDPGCIMKFALVLEGEQSAGKTPWIKSLAPCKELYTTIDISDARANSNETNRKLKGRAIVEFEELGGIGKADANKIKKTISEQLNEYRQHYAQGYGSPERSLVFLVSTNEKNGYLRDYTGNTRFGPVRLDLNPKKMQFVDQAGFDDIYHQLLAQNIELFEQGHEAYFTEEEIALQETETKKREYTNEEYEWVEDYFQEKNGDLTNLEIAKQEGVSWEEICRIKADIMDKQKHRDKILQSLGRFGFTKSATAWDKELSKYVRKRFYEE
jgi:hypothetical protein